MPIPVEWIRRDPNSWLGATLQAESFDPPQARGVEKIEFLAGKTDSLGRLPLWDAYEQPGATRRPDDVRVWPEIGLFFHWLVVHRRPSIVVEFGSAFGVSAMYWLSGLESIGCGELLAFEPNPAWAEIAQRNLVAIGSRFQLTNGTFEQHIQQQLAGRTIDIAYIDAIHKCDIVLPQFHLVMQHLTPGGLILFDDIDFSDDMRNCWLGLANEPRVRSSVALAWNHLGLVELGVAQ